MFYGAVWTIGDIIYIGEEGVRLGIEQWFID